MIYGGHKSVPPYQRPWPRKSIMVVGVWIIPGNMTTELPIMAPGLGQPILTTDWPVDFGQMWKKEKKHTGNLYTDIYNRNLCSCPYRKAWCTQLLKHTISRISGGIYKSIEIFRLLFGCILPVGHVAHLRWSRFNSQEIGPWSPECDVPFLWFVSNYFVPTSSLFPSGKQTACRLTSMISTAALLHMIELHMHGMTAQSDWRKLLLIKSCMHMTSYYVALGWAHCPLVVLGSPLEQHLPAWPGLAMIFGFLHGHLAQQVLHCGCWLLSSTASPSMLCIAVGPTSHPTRSALVVVGFLHGHMHRPCTMDGPWTMDASRTMDAPLSYHPNLSNTHPKTKKSTGQKVKRTKGQKCQKVGRICRVGRNAATVCSYA